MHTSPQARAAWASCARPLRPLASRRRRSARCGAGDLGGLGWGGVAWLPACSEPAAKPSLIRFPIACSAASATAASSSSAALSPQALAAPNAAKPHSRRTHATRTLPQIVAPLGPGAVALAARSQEDAGSLIVDEYEQAPGGGKWGLTRIAAGLSEFLAAQRLRVALVPDVSAAAGSNAAAIAARGASPQSTNHVLMVAPTAFGFNEQAAADNSFMHSGEAAAEGGSALTRQVGRRRVLLCAMHTPQAVVLTWGQLRLSI